MAAPFTDNPEKGVVRTAWDTPLLQYLHQKHKVRYRYLGLPGVDLIDVHLWKPMIDEVIAFEPPDNSANRRAAIDKLRKNMHLHSIKGVAYWGSFEQVVMLRRDLDGQYYTQAKFVTLYNLDFCDEITSAVETPERRKQVLRFEAIRQILRDQATFYVHNKKPRHFILMLTVRNQSSSTKLRKLLAEPNLLASAKAHHDGCNKLLPIPPRQSELLIGTHAWALKTVVFNYLTSYFSNPCLSALFFPQVLYTGTPIYSSAGTREKVVDSPMLHWVILCRFAEPDQVAADCTPVDYLTRSSVAVGPDKTIVWSPQIGEQHPNGNPPDCVEWLKAHGAAILQDL